MSSIENRIKKALIEDENESRGLLKDIYYRLAEKGYGHDWEKKIYSKACEKVGDDFLDGWRENTGQAGMIIYTSRAGSLKCALVAFFNSARLSESVLDGGRSDINEMENVRRLYSKAHNAAEIFFDNYSSHSIFGTLLHALDAMFYEKVRNYGEKCEELEKIEDETKTRSKTRI